MADTMVELKRRWDDLTGWVVDEVKTKWWNRIVAAYTEPHRKYHTLDHLEQMFKHYDAHKDRLRDRYACAYAIFFHDIVYKPESSANEEHSAKLFVEFSHETTMDSATYITTLISATTSHCTEAHIHKEKLGDDDLHYFLDFDMAILGSAAPEYDEYARRIRQEYAHMDDAQYAQNRSKLLKLFLQIPNIFATKVFRDEYEEIARHNVTRELDALAKS